MIRTPKNTPLDTMLGQFGHAFKIAPLAESLSAALMWSPLAQDKHTHVIESSRGGPNSWSLRLADGREYHFRKHDDRAHLDSIEVRDAYRNGRTIAILRTRAECRQFASKLRCNPFVARANEARAA